jgi:hypothetical protein
MRLLHDTVVVKGSRKFASTYIACVSLMHYYAPSLFLFSLSQDAAAAAAAPAIVASTAQLQAGLNRLHNDSGKVAVHSLLNGIADEADCQSQLACFIDQGSLGASVCFPSSAAYARCTSRDGS